MGTAGLRPALVAAHQECAGKGISARTGLDAYQLDAERLAARSRSSFQEIKSGGSRD